MTLNQLRAFLAVHRLGSFSAAAVELGMTQPSISELVRRLEEEYRLKLFVRGSRRLGTTPAGQDLLPLAEQAVQAADQADRTLRSVSSLTGGVAIFGLLRNANYYFLSQLVETFHVRHPDVRLRIIGLNSVEVADAVASGDLEAGLVVLPIDNEGLHVTPLIRSEVLFASANPERVARPVTMKDLAANPLVLYDAHYGWRDPTRRQLWERAQLAGVELDISVEVEHVESALGVVALGSADTIVSKAIVQSGTFPPGLFTAPFAEPLYDTIALVRRTDAVLSPATREIARVARAILLEHADPADLVSGQEGDPSGSPAGSPPGSPVGSPPAA